MRLGEAFIAITTRDETDAGYNAARQKANGFVRDISQGIAQGVGQAIARGIGNLLRAGIEQIGESIGAASDLNESINKVGVAFADSSQEILEWSKSSEKALLLSRQAALESASSFGILFRQLGIGAKETAGMSEQMVQLAADLASINNIPVDEALEKLRSGLVGEVRPLRDVGILLNDEVVTREAVNEGLATSTKNVSDQAKVLARYNLILQQTALQQGDVARTLEGTANQQREFAASIEDIQASVGSVFEPIYNAFLRNINKLIQDNRQWGEQVLESFATGLAAGIRSMIPFFAQLRAIFSYWMQPHSPPKFLPDLAKWGTDALKIYLQGWTKGDFSELKDLGGAIEGILRGYSSAGRIGENDLVSRIFGSTQAIARAVDEFRRLGSVSAGSLEAIRRAAGPAGDSVTGLVESFFELQKATRAATDAQRELDSVTRAYDARLKPLNDKLDANAERQQKIRDDLQLKELGDTVKDPTKSVGERQLARLEQQAILLRRQQSAVEKERDSAVDAEQKKLDAAKESEKAAQEVFDKQQAVLDQQTKINQLAGEQIQLDEQAAAKRKAAADEAQRLAERLHDAMLAYQLSLSDTSGKIAILRGELGKTKEGSAEYFQLLEQINGLEQQQADESKRKAETLHDAQLAYNLALTDTAGQIAIWREELARTTPGTAEFFDILTRIANLQKSLEGQGGGGGGLVGLTPGDVTTLNSGASAYKDLGDAVQDLFNVLTGTNNNGASLSDTLRSTAPTVDLSQNVKDFVDAIKSLTKAIGDAKGPLEVMEQALITLGLATGDTKDDAEKSATGITTAFGNAAKTIDGIFNLDWKLALSGLVGLVSAALTQIANMLPGADGGEAKDPTSPIANVKKMGQAFFGTLFVAGLVTGQSALVTTYIGILQWLRDQLPGSEPKDASSPLYGLKDAGSAIIGNIWDGLKTKWNEFSQWWTEKMGWILNQIPALPSWLGGGSVTGSSYSAPSLTPSMPRVSSLSSQPSINTATTNNSLGPVQLVFNGPVSDASARSAANTLDGELRKRGWK